MGILQAAGVDIVLMQCNTNYTGDIENLNYVNLNVLKQFSGRYPDAILGLSDHTPGHVTVLGAVALGARVIEKHFTDDITRTGPDHGFSLDPAAWRAMVDDTRRLEAALGDGIKGVEKNELKTAVLQRRCIRAARDLDAGTRLAREDLEVLRPAPADAIPAHDVSAAVGSTIARSLVAGEHLTYADLT